MIIIITTIKTKEKAREIGKGLLKERLVACYNLAPIESAYWWKGKITEENETLMLLKTKDDHFEKVETFIKTHSGYEIPEVIAVSPNKVNASYLNWINSETQ